VVARVRSAAAILMSLALVVASGTGCSAADDVAYSRGTVDGQAVAGVVRGGAPVRGLVVYFHGADRDESILDLDEPHRELTAMLADAGYAVVAGSGGGNAWGNAASQRNYVDLAFGAAEHYGATDIFFITESMGTLAAMNLMAHNRVPVVGMAAINPLLDVNSMSPKYRAQAVEANSGDALTSVNPVDFTVQSMTGRNVRFYVTPDDRLVPTAQNAAAFQKRFGDVADISIVRCSGEHMDASCIQGKDIISWFSSLSTR
jgi:alpha-beta hydrolase superfamily lysophospholipase